MSKTSIAQAIFQLARCEHTYSYISKNQTPETTTGTRYLPLSLFFFVARYFRSHIYKIFVSFILFNTCYISE